VSSAGFTGFAAALLFAGILSAAGQGQDLTGPRGRFASESTPVAASEPRPRADRERVASIVDDGRRAAAQAESRGERAESIATILAATAQRLWDIEAYAAALPLAERALAIRRAADPSDRPDLANNLYQVADLHRALGDYAGALRGLGLAAAMWEKTLGAGSAPLAAALHYLGVIRLTTGDPRAARPLLERALTIRERALGENDVLVAATLMALAGVEEAEGRTEAERVRLEQALSIWSAAPGPDHAHVARCLTSLARLAAREGRPAEAERLLGRAYDIRVSAFGPDHYLAARSLVDRAALLAGEGEDAEAMALAARALALQRGALGPDHPEVAGTLLLGAECERRLGEGRAAFEDALQAEGIARRWFRRTAWSLTDEDTLRYEAIRTSGLDLALSLLTAGDAPPDGAVRAAEEVLASRALALDETAAARRGRTAHSVPEHVDGTEGSLLESVLSAIPPEAALVSYVRTGGTYLAFVLRPSRPPVFARLGGTDAIDARVLAWRREATADPRTRPRAEEACAEAGRELRAAVWDPIVPAVGHASLVFLVPDGSLNLVNFAALPADRGDYLLERGPALHYLSAERDLIALRDPPALGQGILVLGSPDVTAAPEPDESGAASGPTEPGGLPACADFDDLDLAALPGSGAEAEEVAALWSDGGDVLRLSGAGASEAAFVRTSPGRRVLHLATHAFLLPDRCDERAGLVLAGAARLKSGAWPLDASKDGILTAEEIAGLDLSGVEWAVLSGCDTGNGTVRSGEGVLGLRRAFQIAGARTVIMSLWSVDDGAARLWMRALYTARRDGLGTAAAVAAAGKSLLDGQRRRGATTHPYFWGAFVAAGDWR
jgi:CHAT domain-containing protein